MPIVDDIAGLRRILTRSRTLAVVGLSAQWYRPSYFAAKYMRDHGYRIIPVNPRYEEVLGERCYPDLRSIPEPVDLVDCFRKSADIPPIADAAIAIGAKVLWMQLGVRNDAAAAKAEAAGLTVIMNRCPKIEYGRLHGELSWGGFNSRIISSKRQKLGAR
jgi:predicted CoA-binding protein